MGIHWLSPTLMVSCLLLGTTFAIGHHIFYSQLAGTEAPSGSYTVGGFKFSKQQGNTQAGTAFAFLVQACLAASVVTAYAQLFWRSTVSQGAAGTALLTHLDVAYGVTSNVFLLFRPKVWAKRPVPFLLALVAWLLPIASIITPGTLSVSLETVNPTPTQQLLTPELDFTNLAMAADLASNGFHPVANDGGNDNFTYGGPSQAVVRIANSVASGGRILPLTPPAPNASWSMDFDGPSLRCIPLDNTRSMELGANLVSYNFERPGCVTPYGYLAWTRSGLPLSTGVNASSLRPISALSPGGNYTELFLAALPGMWTVVAVPSHVQSAACSGSNDPQITADNPMGGFGENSTMLQCRLFNSLYHLGFNYTNGQQDISVRVDGIDESQPLSTISNVYGPATFTAPNCSSLNLDGRLCFFDVEVARRLSYQSIMSAFNSLVVGTIQKIISPTEASGKSSIGSRVDTTTLLDTPELAFLRDRQPGSGSSNLFPSLQYQLAEVGSSASNEISTAAMQPLSQALEQLFQNITISLLSSPNLLINTSSPNSAQRLTTVRLPTYRNIYIYGSSKLWLAYGLGISFTAMAVIIALIVVVTTGASYSSSFSTIFRTVRYAHIEPDVHVRDADGKDPLPKYLEGAEVALGPMTEYKNGLELSGRPNGEEGKQPIAEDRLLGHDIGSSLS